MLNLIFLNRKPIQTKITNSILQHLTEVYLFKKQHCYRDVDGPRVCHTE